MIKNKIFFLLLIMIIAGALTAGDADAWSCSSPPDPRSNWSGYSSWCSQCANGGSAYKDSRGVGCDPGSGTRSSGSSSGGYSQPSAQVEAERRASEDRERILREQRKKRKKERKRIAEERKRDQQKLDEETRRIFLKNKKEAVSSLKGVSGGSLEFKRSDGDQWKLKGAEAKVTTFKLKTLSEANGGVGEGENYRVWKQLNCGASIASHAMKAANPKDGSAVNIEELRFLGEQSINALVGEALRVECPAVMEPPAKPYGEIKLSDSAPLVLFYKALHKDTEEQVIVIEEAAGELTEYSKAKRDHQIEIYKIEEKIKELKSEVLAEGEVPEEVFQESRKESEPNIREEEKSKVDALAIAIAALKKAKQAEADATAAMESAMKRRSQAQIMLNRNEQLFNRIKKDPDKAQEMLNDFKSGNQSAS